MEESVPHAELKLEASEYKTTAFRKALLEVLQIIKVPTWSSTALEPQHVQISEVSGGLTNTIFFISYAETAPPTSTTIPQTVTSSTPHLTDNSLSHSQISTPCTVLLRIYGAPPSMMLSRTDELRILHVLSSVYHIGPRVFGTFSNGRIEEWFDSSTLTSKDLQDPLQSRWIGMRLKELHNVDMLRVMGSTWDGHANVLKTVVGWRGAAQGVLDTLKAKELKGEIGPGHAWYGTREKFDLAEFVRAWDAYWAWLHLWEGEHGRSEMVFAHNDLVYGNLLRLNQKLTGEPEHHKIIIIDFEYAGPNPVGFDIALHFLEWAGDYHSSDSPYLLKSSRYPTREERRNFYYGYVGAPVPGGPLVASPAPSGQPSSHVDPSLTSVDSLASASTGLSGVNGPKLSAGSITSAPNSITQRETEEAIDLLDAQVYAWSAASRAFCVMWAIVQSSDDVMNGTVGGFNYVGYAIGRFEAFKQDLAQRGIKW